MRSTKIGIFDSGIGGLSVLKELLKILPQEDYIFYEDSINNPYGEKTDEELFTITSKIVKYLINMECGLIVIACNTATISCIDKLKKEYPNIIFVGIVPDIKAASYNYYKNTILLATSYTIKSNVVRESIYKYKNIDQKIYPVSGMNLANLIDNDDQKNIDILLNKLLLPYKNIADSIILGCTHYPLVKSNIEKILPNCKIIDGTYDVAQEVLYQLELHNIKKENTNKGTITIINTKSEQLVKRSYEILANVFNFIK